MTDSTSQIPTHCKAGVVVNEGPDFRVEVKMVPVPTPGPDEVLLRLNATGLCMSDVHFMLADWGLPVMSTFGVTCAGHEGAGVVVAVGANVKDWKVGDRGGIKPLWDVCGNCEMCYTGRENYCQKGVYTGLMAQGGYGVAGDRRATHADTLANVRLGAGTYQQYLTSPARYTSRIPDGVNDYIAGPVMCSASTMYRALTDADMRAGQWAVFPGGGGGVGIQGVQLAKAMGLRPVVVDAGEEKKKLALKYGAEAFVDFRETEDVAARVKEICDGVGAHGVFVTAYQSYAAAITYVADRISAKIVCIALRKLVSRGCWRCWSVQTDAVQRPRITSRSAPSRHTLPCAT